MDNILVPRQAQLPSIPRDIEQSLYQYLSQLSRNIEKLQRSTYDTFSTLSYFDRGDPSSVDYNETGSKAVIDTDGDWHALTLRSKISTIPIDIVAVLLRVSMTDDAVGSTLYFRKNGNSNAINVATVSTQVANEAIYADVVVACDDTQTIEYKGDNLAFTDISITIAGWWK